MMNIRLKEASTATPQNPQVRLSSCPQPELHLSSVVSRQRERLTQLLYGPMQKIATSYGKIAGEQEKPWTYRSTVDAFLVDVFASVPFAKYLYVMNASGVQISSSVSREGLLPEHFRRDRSDPTSPPH